MAVIQEIAFINHLPSTSCDEQWWTYFCYTLRRWVLSNKRAPCPQTRTCRTWRDWKTNKLIRIFELQFVFCTHAYISKNLVSQEFSITKLRQHFFKKIYLGFRPLFFQSQVVGRVLLATSGRRFLNFNGLCSTQREIKVGARGWVENSPVLRCHTHNIFEKVAMKIYEGSIGQHYWRMSWENVILMWNNIQKLGV